MKLKPPLTALLLACCLTPTAWACKLSASAYDLKAFWEKDNPRKVVFLGEVATVTDTPGDKLLHDQRIQFLVHRWWAGQPQPSVNARGVVTKPTGDDCDSAWDFAVASGQEWLVVGYEETEDGQRVVRPSALLSRQLDGARLPKEVTDLLQTPAFTGMKLAPTRKALLKAGWRPRRTYQKLDAKALARATADTKVFLKAGYREVEICAGTGLNPCYFNYVRNKACLRVETVGASPASAIVIGADAECPQRLP